MPARKKRIPGQHEPPVANTPYAITDYSELPQDELEEAGHEGALLDLKKILLENICEFNQRYSESFQNRGG